MISDRSRPPLVPTNLPAASAPLVGRDAEIGAVEEALARDARVAIVPAAGASWRLGGAGASALALAFAQRAARARAFPGGVYRIDASGPPAAAMARLAADLEVIGSPAMRGVLDEEPLDASIDDLCRAARAAMLAERARSLLVLDDVDDPGWAEVLPAGEVRVLSTVRDDRFAFRRRVTVGPLSAAAAGELARAIGGRPRDGADRLALESLAGHDLRWCPLALELAARWVKETGRSWSACAARVRARSRLLSAEPEAPHGYSPAITAAVDASIERHDRDTPARRLLEGAAVFAPVSVPLAWALAAAELPADDPAAGDALASLSDLGLVAVEEGAAAISLHRLVRQRARDLCPVEAWVRVSRRAAAAAAIWLEEPGGGLARRREVDARRAHVDEALAAADRAGSDLAWVIIAERLAAHLAARGRLAEARALAEGALTRAERLEPPNPGQVRVCLSGLAAVLMEAGGAREATGLLERALAIEDEAGGDAPGSVRLSKLSRVLSGLGRRAAAQPLLERALALGDGADDPPSGLSPALPDAAQVLHELTRAAGASPLVASALEGEGPESSRLAAVLGAVHRASETPAEDGAPPAAPLLSRLGLALYALGRHADARALLSQALAQDEATYGPDHPEVAADLLSLAAAARAMGDVAEALACLARARAIAEHTLPEDAPLRRGIEARLASL